MFSQLQGLVISETRVNDTDKLLSVVSFEKGKLSLKAKGVMRKGSALAVGCQFLCLSDFTVFENRGMPRINSAEPCEMFLGLRNDPAKLALGGYIAEVLGQLSESDTDCSELLRLGLNCLYALSALDKPSELIRAAFELRAMVLSGFEPDLTGCEFCGDDEHSLFFDLRRGAPVCERCRSVVQTDRGIALPLTANLLSAMRHFAHAPLQKLLSVRLDDTSAEALVGITEAYMMTQLERNFKSLDFYKGFRISL
ncbi:MAG: DNA repair protein RecO [Clostridia bacterium]|nr:DNA repair protein RecO [Clostridia bacterium]